MPDRAGCLEELNDEGALEQLRAICLQQAAMDVKLACHMLNISPSEYFQIWFSPSLGLPDDARAGSDLEASARSGTRESITRVYSQEQKLDAENFC